MIRNILAFTLPLAVTPAHAATWPICHYGQPATACVVDGDTVHWRGHKIRLTQSDAPEISEPGCEAERIAGIAARDRLATLLSEGADVRLTGHKDRYGRDLGSIITPAGDAEEILIGEGLSLPYQRGKKARAARAAHWCGEGR